MQLKIPGMAAGAMTPYGLGWFVERYEGRWPCYAIPMGSVVWQMPGQPFARAGGAAKNQKVDETIDLPAGKYVLRYKSDWGHAYNHWDSLPPDHFFWGIVLLNAAK